MFQIMLSAGMPELQTKKNIHYIQKKLCLGKSDSICFERFMKELEASRTDVRRRVDNFIHNTA